jgi:hypothetical protein
MYAKPSSTYLRLQAKKGPWKSAKQAAKGTKIMPVAVARSPYRRWHGSATPHKVTLAAQTLAETFVATLDEATDGRQCSRFRPPRPRLGYSWEEDCSRVRRNRKDVSQVK